MYLNYSHNGKQTATQTEGLETKIIQVVKACIKSTFPLINVVAFKLAGLRLSGTMGVNTLFCTRLVLLFRLTQHVTNHRNL